jgi:hypothetical protein
MNNDIQEEAAIFYRDPSRNGTNVRSWKAPVIRRLLDGEHDRTYTLRADTADASSATRRDGRIAHKRNRSDKRVVNHSRCTT